jgi:hypothetical protein
MVTLMKIEPLTLIRLGGMLVAVAGCNAGSHRDGLATALVCDACVMQEPL